jgi:hypothetical protein
MTKIMKVTIVYLVQREVEVICADDTKSNDIVESALEADVSIRDNMPQHIKAVRELLDRAISRHVTGLEELKQEKVCEPEEGE